MADLFGFEASESGDAVPLTKRPTLVLTAPRPRGKHYVEPRGYAAMPGTGPQGKQCRHCAHYTHQSGVAGNFPKCGANQARWTGGRASDILARAPACSKFVEQER
jgi:hypothetical protein